MTRGIIPEDAERGVRKGGDKKRILPKNLIGILFLFMLYILFRPEAKEGILSKRPGAYKGEKRRKELARQKKQEERRQRRFQSGDHAPSENEKEVQDEKKPANP